MADQLTLYNQALAFLGKRALASLTDQREERHALDVAWSVVTAYCLERKFWNFTYRSIEIDASSTVTPLFGFLYAFTIPDDWIRTRLLSAVPTFSPPLLDVKEETGYWFANLTPIYVQYNSNDLLYGMNVGKWPSSFADYVALRLASQSCVRITGANKLLSGSEGLVKQEQRAYKIAAANCAMNEAVGFAPASSWVRSRRGFSPMLPGPGGDDPTGGSLIP
jgi:hypothetical protein